MTIEQVLYERSDSQCELCSATDELLIYGLNPDAGSEITADKSIMVCKNCQQQIDNPDKINVNHWRCLNDSMWSQVPAVQVMAWRMLTRLRAEGWPQDLLDMLYLDEELLNWAQATDEGDSDDDSEKHLDNNGAILKAGDTVVIVKDLNVKGTSFIAKQIQ